MRGWKRTKKPARQRPGGLGGRVVLSLALLDKGLRGEGTTHIACFHEAAMEGEGVFEAEWLVTIFGEREIAAQFVPEIRVGAAIDNDFRPLARIEAAQIGDAVFGDDDLHGVLAVVRVRDLGHDGADLATLLERGAGEDGEVGIAGEVARTTDPVHHRFTKKVCAVDVTLDVGLDSGIHGHDTQAAHDFWIVAYLLRAQDDTTPQGMEVRVEFAQSRGAEGERAAAGELKLALAKKGEGGVLQNLRIHEKGRYFGVASEGAEYGVGDVAHAGLEREEAGGDAASSKFGSEEVGDIFADFEGDGIRGGKAAGLIIAIGVNDTGDLGWVDMEPRLADAVRDGIQGDLAALRRITGLVDIVQAAKCGRVAPVELDDDALAAPGVGGGGAHSAR